MSSNLGTVAETGEVGDDRDAGPAHRVPALAADADEFELARVLNDLLGGEADGVSVEGAGQAAIARDEDDEPLALVAATEQRVLVTREDGGEIRQDLVEQVGVGSRGQGRILGTAELGRRHELHRPGYLSDVPRRRDASSDVSLARHAALPGSVM